MPFPVAVWRKVEWTKVWSRLMFVVEVISSSQPVNKTVKKSSGKYWLWWRFCMITSLICTWIGETNRPVPAQVLEPDPLCLLPHLLTRHLSTNSTCIRWNRGIWNYGILQILFHVLLTESRQADRNHVLLQELVQTKWKDWPNTIVKPPNQGPQKSNPCQTIPGQTICFGGWWAGEQPKKEEEEQESLPAFSLFALWQDSGQPSQTDVKTTFSKPHILSLYLEWMMLSDWR